MARKKKRQSAQQAGFAVPPTPKQTENRDFGVLKARGVNQKQSQARVYIDSKNQGSNFRTMGGERLLNIVYGNDLPAMRELSRYYARTNGIYARATRYLSDIYRFDFMIYPNLQLDLEIDEKTKNRILKSLNIVLEHFDASGVQALCRRWAAQVCLDGVYYGYICDDVKDKLVIQDLPVDYCRSRFSYRGTPMVEFNVQYFDKVTRDVNYRKQLLNLFPEEIRKGYVKFTNGSLPAETQGDDAGWIFLDSRYAFKFNLNDRDIPPFLYVIPALLNLAEVQDLEKEKLLQEIQKILIQRFELDKNGQLPFTMNELRTLNSNALDAVGDVVGTSVLSTVADVHLEDLTPEGRPQDKTEVAQRSVYNDMGISMNLFNTNGNLALEKSILTDTAFVKQLYLQFEAFFNNYIINNFNKGKNGFRLKMLETSIFNYVDLSDKYKDLTKIGFSRFLPMVALGHTQKEVISMAKLEQQIIELDNWMLPPFSSNTMSSGTWSDIKQIQQKGSTNIDQIIDGDNKGGRPELKDSDKSEKTIANIEAQG